MAKKKKTKSEDEHSIPKCLGFHAGDSTCDGDPEAADPEMRESCPVREECIRLQSYATETGEDADELIKGHASVESVVRMLDEQEDDDSDVEDEDDSDVEDEEEDVEDEEEDVEDDSDVEDEDDVEDDVEDEDENQESEEDEEEAEPMPTKKTKDKTKDKTTTKKESTKSKTKSTKKTSKKSSKKKTAPAKDETSKKSSKKKTAKAKTKDSGSKKTSKKKTEPEKPECFEDETKYNGNVDPCKSCPVGKECKTRVYTKRTLARRKAKKKETAQEPPKKPKTTTTKGSTPKSPQTSAPVATDGNPVLGVAHSQGWDVQDFGTYQEVGRFVGRGQTPEVFLRVFEDGAFLRVATSDTSPAGLRADPSFLVETLKAKKSDAPGFDFDLEVKTKGVRKSLIETLTDEPSII